MQNPVHLPPPAATIKEALQGAIEQIDPLHEMLTTMEAVFRFIQFLQIDPELKEAFEPLRKQYEFYSSLVVLAASNDMH